MTDLYKQVFAQPKIKNWYSEDYLEFIRSQEPILLREHGDHSDIVPHHHRKHTDGGGSLKPSDIWAVPVTAFQHEKIHRGIIVLSQELVMIDVIRLMTKYLLLKEIK